MAGTAGAECGPWATLSKFLFLTLVCTINIHTFQKRVALNGRELLRLLDVSTLCLYCYGQCDSGCPIGEAVIPLSAFLP